MLPYFLKQLQETPDGDGSLLDNTLVMDATGHDLASFGDSEGTFSWE